MELGLNLKQSLSISPQVIQNLEILQMGSQQLLQYIQKLAEENPTIELDEAYSQQSDAEQFRLKLLWLKEMDVQNKVYYKADGDVSDPFASVSDDSETLSDYLVSQLGEADIPGNLKRAAEFIAMSLNENGFLTDSPKALAAGSGFTEKTLKNALSLIKTLDPPGVGAADLRECLSLQLDRLDTDSALAKRIVADFLPDLASKSPGKLSKLLGVDEAAAEEACSLIRSLNPRPSSGYAAVESTVYITPDIIVVSFPDHFQLLTNDYYFPGVGISSYYLGLLSENNDDEVKKYLTEKLRQAKWAISGISQRKSMLLRCSEQIVSRQESFFRGGSLLPLTMAELASALDVHESTVSRAVKDKFLQCSRGVYPLSRFFSRALGSDNPTSPDGAKELIKSVIESENPAAPYSDCRLAEVLNRKGVDISRRTVAKYRDLLGIPTAAKRKGR